MIRARCLGFLFPAMIGVFFSFPSAVCGDSGNVGTLAEVHETLLQAAGYGSDTPPALPDQTKLLNKALKMIKTIPHVYHGQLKEATRCINAALSELGNGDTAHKAREYIFDADDQIKAIM